MNGGEIRALRKNGAEIGVRDTRLKPLCLLVTRVELLVVFVRGEMERRGFRVLTPYVPFPAREEGRGAVQGKGTNMDAEVHRVGGAGEGTVEKSELGISAEEDISIEKWDGGGIPGT